MSGMQGWPGPGAGAPPGPAPGGSDGKRIAILAMLVVAVVGISFGLAKATGADSYDAADAGASSVTAGMTGGGLGGLEGMDLGGLESTGGVSAGGEIAGADIGGGDIAGGDLGGTDIGGSDIGGGDIAGGDLGGSDLGGASGDSGSSGSSYGSSGGQTTPPPDPTFEAYAAVNQGDCLNNWMVGETEWVSDLPEVISCDADGAGVWVSQVADSTSACYVDAGRSYLSYTSAEGETVALCVTRQFKVRQCFLGMPDGSANLMSWVDCQGNSVPAPYDKKYNVTAVYQAPANPTGDECRQSTYDQNQYYYWTIDGGTVLLCAVVFNG